MDAATMTGGIFYLAAMLFLVVLAILWFLLPFAVFGVKGRMDDMTMHVKDLKRELTMLRRDLNSQEQSGQKADPDDPGKITPS